MEPKIFKQGIFSKKCKEKFPNPLLKWVQLCEKGWGLKMKDGGEEVAKVWRNVLAFCPSLPLDDFFGVEADS